MAAVQQAEATEALSRTANGRTNGYFKLLRRKIGVITLVLACVLTAGWVRSRFQRDRFLISTSNLRTHGFEFVDGTMIWATVSSSSEEDAAPQHRWRFGKWHVEKFAPISRILVEAYELPVGQLRFGAGIIENENARFRIVPFWPIVIPLTLLSAWLLLSKLPTNTVQPTTPDSKNA